MNDLKNFNPKILSFVTILYYFCNPQNLYNKNAENHGPTKILTFKLLRPYGICQFYVAIHLTLNVLLITMYTCNNHQSLWYRHAYNRCMISIITIMHSMYVCRKLYMMCTGKLQMMMKVKLNGIFLLSIDLNYTYAVNHKVS